MYAIGTNARMLYYFILMRRRITVRKKIETMEKLAIMNGKLVDIGHKVSKGNISDEEVVKQLKDVEKSLHELINQYSVQ